MEKLLSLIPGKKKNSRTTGMIHTKKIVCKDCNTEYEIPISANFMYFCPKCRKLIGFECEYGYWAITPCEIYLGEKHIGRITGGGRSTYILECRPLGIGITNLTGGYRDVAAYNEAAELIVRKLTGR